MKIVRYILFVVSIATSLSIHAQNIININGKEFLGNKGYINGKLMDKETGEEIIGAIVSIDELKEAAVTDINGEFRLRVPKGEFDISASMVGFEKGVYKIRVLGSGNFRLYLETATTELDEIVVTGTRQDANIASTDVGKNALSIESIKELPLTMGEIDIIKSLTLLPGVSTNSELSSGFNVRGGGTDQNLVLLGDVPIFNPAHLFGFYTAFNADVVDDVSLYKGGVPAHYGGRASSVLHVKYRDGDYDRWHADISAGVVSSKMAVEGPIIKQRLSVLGSVRRSYLNYTLAAFEDPDIRESSAGFYDFNIITNLKLNDNNKLTYSVYKSGDDFNLASDTIYNWINFYQSANWYHSFSEKLSLKATGALSSYTNSIEGASVINPFIQRAEIANQIANLDVEYINNEHLSVNIGANLTKTDLQPGEFEPQPSEDNALEYVKVQNETGLEIAYYLESSFDLGPKLAITSGIRFNTYKYLGDHLVYEYEAYRPQSEQTIIDSVRYGKGESIADYSGWEPRFSARYKLGETSSIKIGYNRMFQYIQLISNTTTIAPNDIWKLSDNYIKPQISEQISMGFYKNFQENRYEASLEGFYKETDNVVDYKDGANLVLNDHIESELLSGQGKSYGLEFYAKKNTGGRTRGWVSYTYSKSLRKIQGPYRYQTINEGNWYAANYDRRHLFTGVVIYQLPKKWEFSGTFTFKTGQPVTYPEGKFEYNSTIIPQYNYRNQERAPLYHRLDISFSKNFFVFNNKKAEFNFSVYNLYGRKNSFSVFTKDVAGAPPQAYQLAVLGVPFPSMAFTFHF
jgi:hypothetical protein